METETVRSVVRVSSLSVRVVTSRLRVLSSSSLVIRLDSRDIIWLIYSCVRSFFSSFLTSSTIFSSTTGACLVYSSSTSSSSRISSYLTSIWFSSTGGGFSSFWRTFCEGVSFRLFLDIFLFLLRERSIWDCVFTVY